MKHPVYKGHANKNSAGQAVSFIRTIHYGDYWVDYMMTREFGMPPAVLARDSPMSDRFQAIFSNPYFLIQDAVPWSQ